MASKRQDIQKIARSFEIASNPLRYLSTNEIENLFQLYRWGNDVRLQIIFEDIERQMPVYSICVEKRLAGILGRDWDVLPIDDSREARMQAEKVKEILDKSDMKNIDGLTEALRHLGLASFRGRSCIKPFWIGDELVLKRLDNWNVLQRDGKLYWSPEGYFKDFNLLQEIPQNEVCWVRSDNPIDIPGLQIYLRQLVGESTWAQAVERYGLAQIVIKAPEGTPDTALPEWNARAMNIWNGGSGVLPPGAELDVLNEARGQDPFAEFIKHQTEMIAIMATGSSTIITGGSTGLGSNLAEKQDEQFQALVNSDCKKISNALTDVVVKSIVEHFFGNSKQLCRFTFVTKDIVSPKEYLEMAQAAVNVGFEIDLEEFKKRSGLTFIKNKDVFIPESVEETKKDETQEWTPEEKEQLKQEMKSEDYK